MCKVWWRKGLFITGLSGSQGEQLVRLAEGIQGESQTGGWSRSQCFLSQQWEVTEGFLIEYDLCN